MCNNEVSYWIPSGCDYREVLTKCGNTDYHGARAICHECRQDANIMQDIERQEKNIAADNARELVNWARSSGYGEY